MIYGRRMNHDDLVVPWETEHDFKFTVNFEEEEEEEDKLTTMNDIIEDVFSFRRGKRKAFLITRAGKRAALKIKKKKNSEGEESNENISKEFVMSNGFVIKTKFKGSISLIEKS
jgi:hypothetical protein